MVGICPQAARGSAGRVRRIGLLPGNRNTEDDDPRAFIAELAACFDRIFTMLCDKSIDMRAAETAAGTEAAKSDQVLRQKRPDAQP
jgi:hypothetical protein